MQYAVNANFIQEYERQAKHIGRSDWVHNKSCATSGVDKIEFTYKDNHAHLSPDDLLIARVIRPDLASAVNYAAKRLGF